MALNAPAKVNLALHVTGRRADNYHLLDSVAVFAEVGDRIEFARADRPMLSISGRFAAHAPGDRRDLAWRAAEAFFAHGGREPAIAISVEKNIPAGAGLGGGSADAAAVLSGLNQFFGTQMPLPSLAAIAAKLGADVPMCLAGTALRARGIGEDIERLPGWPPLPLLLVWPGRSLSTAEVFAKLEERENPPLPTPPSGGTVDEIATWLSGCRNDLEAPALALAPEIGVVLWLLRNHDGCTLARMSGSGSACFGIFPSLAAAETAAVQLRQERPGWWIEAALAH